MMTYERYKELVPQDTLEFTNKLLLFTKNDGSTSLVRYKKNLDNQN